MKHITKAFLFVLFVLLPIRNEAQNVFFGDTLHFDSAAVCKLLYSKNIVQKGVNESYFKDTLILSERDKKSIEVLFNKKELTSDDPIIFAFVDDNFKNRELLALDYYTKVKIIRVYLKSDDFWLAVTNPNADHHSVSEIYKSPGIYKFLLKKIKKKERALRRKSKKPTPALGDM